MPVGLNHNTRMRKQQISDSSPFPFLPSPFRTFIICSLFHFFTFFFYTSQRCTSTVQGVPLIQSVSRSERVRMISQSLIKEFREGEYIIRQGEVGEELFIILEGACEVVEDKNFVKSSSSKDKQSAEEKVPNIVKLVTLREGHFFGEMSLMTVRMILFILTFSLILFILNLTMFGPCRLISCRLIFTASIIL